MTAQSKASTLVGQLEEPEISIAAMCDILFVLLTFFMSVTTVDILRTNMNVALPDARDAAKIIEPRRLQVDVLWTPGRGGEIWCEGRKYAAPEMLAPLLSKRAEDKQASAIYIRASKDSQHQYVARLTKVARDANITRIVFGTYPAASAVPTGH